MAVLEKNKIANCLIVFLLGFPLHGRIESKGQDKDQEKREKRKTRNI